MLNCRLLAHFQALTTTQGGGAQILPFGPFLIKMALFAAFYARLLNADFSMTPAAAGFL
jgi:hypothetical protein